MSRFIHFPGGDARCITPRGASYHTSKEPPTVLMRDRLSVLSAVPPEGARDAPPSSCRFGVVNRSVLCARPVGGESQTSPWPTGSSSVTAAGMRIDRDLGAAINLARLGVPTPAVVEQSPAGSGPAAGRGATRETDPAPAGEAAGDETSTRTTRRWIRRGPPHRKARLPDEHANSHSLTKRQRMRYSLLVTCLASRDDLMAADQ